MFEIKLSLANAFLKRQIFMHQCSWEDSLTQMKKSERENKACTVTTGCQESTNQLSK